MSFRINVKPLRERTRNDAKLGELITDNNYGDISIYNATNYYNDKGVKVIHENKVSSTKNIESELYATGIRSDLIHQELKDELAVLGKYNLPNNFNIHKDLDKNIMGSLNYIYNSYSKYKDEDIVSTFPINSILNTVYGIDNETSYSNVLRNILYELLDNTNTSEIKSITLSEIQDRLLNSNGVNSEGIIKDLDNGIRKIDELIFNIDTILEANESNKSEYKNAIKNYVNTKEKLKSKKFVIYNESIFDNNYIPSTFSTNGIQTENILKPTVELDDYKKFYLDIKNNSGENTDKVYSSEIDYGKELINTEFTDHFISNPLSKNFDGDNNLFMLDSYYYNDKINNDSNLMINSDTESNLISFNRANMINYNDYSLANSRLPKSYTDGSKTPDLFYTVFDNRYELKQGDKYSNVFKVITYPRINTISKSYVSNEYKSFYRLINNDLTNAILETYMIDGLTIYKDTYNIKEYIGTNSVAFTTFGMDYLSTKDVYMDRLYESKFNASNKNTFYSSFVSKLSDDGYKFDYPYANYLVGVFACRNNPYDPNTQEAEAYDKLINYKPLNTNVNVSDYNNKTNTNGISGSYNYYRGRGFFTSTTTMNERMQFEDDVVSINKSFRNYFKLYVNAFKDICESDNYTITPLNNKFIFDFKDKNVGKADTLPINLVSLNLSDDKVNYIGIDSNSNINNVEKSLIDIPDSYGVKVTFTNRKWNDTVKRFLTNSLNQSIIPTYTTTNMTEIDNNINNNYTIEVSISLSNSRMKDSLIFKTDFKDIL